MSNCSELHTESDTQERCLKFMLFNEENLNEEILNQDKFEIDLRNSLNLMDINSLKRIRFTNERKSSKILDVLLIYK